MPDAKLRIVGSPVDDDGGPPHDGHMEARIAALEAANIETRDRLARMETRLESLATKADLQEVRTTLQEIRADFHQSLHSLTWRVIGACALLVAASYFIAKYVH